MRKPKKPKGKRVVPKKECQGCNFYIRDISGCAKRSIVVDPTDTCGAFEFRQACRVCGCSHYDPCPEGCWWVEPDLCSACG